MGAIIDKITEFIKEMLQGWVLDNLSTMFTDVNDKVGTIAGEVGKTPSSWNSGIFSMIQSLSENVMVPIAGMIISAILCYELITMVMDKNNMHEIGSEFFFRYLVKACIAVLFVSYTFDITMAIFDVGNHIVTKAAGVITGNASIDVTATLHVQHPAFHYGHWRTDRAWDRNHDRQLMYENHVRLNHRHFIWAHDRNIPLCFSGSGSVCDFEQPGMGQYRKQLYQGTVCFGISGIFHYGVRRYLLRAGIRRGSCRQSSLGFMVGGSLHRNPMLQLI